MVDIEQSSLSAFAKDLLTGLDGGVDALNGIGDERREIFCGLFEFEPFFVGIHASGGKNFVVLGDLGAEHLFKAFEVAEFACADT